MPRIASVTSKQLTVADPFQTKERVVARLGSLPVATYAVAGAANNIDEGSALTVNITTANISNGTVLRWRILDQPEDFNVNTGLVTVSSNIASITVSPVADLITEGPENFRVQLQKLTGTVLAVSDPVTINDTSATTFTIVPDQNTVDEGDTITFTVTLISGEYVPGTEIYWQPSAPEDFTVSFGSITLTDGSATFTATILEDRLTEGTEIVTMRLRALAIDGPIIATSDAITINDTSVPEYNIEAVGLSVNEGSNHDFVVTTIGVPDNTTLYWTASSEDIDPQSGSFIIVNDAGTFSVSVAADFTTEGEETFTVSLRTGSTSGTIVATSAEVTINDTSLTPTYEVTPTFSSVNEGVALGFNVLTTNLPEGTVLYWTVSRPEDFAVNQGTFEIDGSGAGSFFVTPSADATTEGEETFTVSIRTGSVSGTIVATSSSVTINDTSKTPITYALSRSVSSVDEGGSFTITMTTTNASNGTSVSWSFSGVSAEDLGLESTSGTFTINNNTASRTFTVVNDFSVGEGSETFTLTSGGQSISVIINDTSTIGGFIGYIGRPDGLGTSFSQSINLQDANSDYIIGSDFLNDRIFVWDRVTRDFLYTILPTPTYGVGARAGSFGTTAAITHGSGASYLAVVQPNSSVYQDQVTSRGVNFYLLESDEETWLRSVDSNMPGFTSSNGDVEDVRAGDSVFLIGSPGKIVRNPAAGNQGQSGAGLVEGRNNDGSTSRGVYPNFVGFNTNLTGDRWGSRVDVSPNGQFYVVGIRLEDTSGRTNNGGYAIGRWNGTNNHTTIALGAVLPQLAGTFASEPHGIVCNNTVAALGVYTFPDAQNLYAGQVLLVRLSDGVLLHTFSSPRNGNVNFGRALAINDTYLFISMPGGPSADTGEIYVYSLSDYTLVKRIDCPSGYDNMGSEMILEGNTLFTIIRDATTTRYGIGVFGIGPQPT